MPLFEFECMGLLCSGLGPAACFQICLNHALRIEWQCLVPEHSCTALNNDQWALFLPGLLDYGRMLIVNLILDLILNLLRLVLPILHTSVCSACWAHDPVSPH